MATYVINGPDGLTTFRTVYICKLEVLSQCVGNVVATEWLREYEKLVNHHEQAAYQGPDFELSETDLLDEAALYTATDKLQNMILQVITDFETAEQSHHEMRFKLSYLSTHNKSPGQSDCFVVKKYAEIFNCARRAYEARAVIENKIKTMHKAKGIERARTSAAIDGIDAAASAAATTADTLGDQSYLVSPRLILVSKCNAAFRAALSAVFGI